MDGGEHVRLGLLGLGQAGARGRQSTSASGSPVTWTVPANVLRSRLRRASPPGANSTSDSRSVSTRLRSSGMSGRKLRRPASTWRSGRAGLLAARAPARVALVSPRTSTPSGRSASISSVSRAGGRVDLLGVGQRADAEVVVGHREPQVGDLETRTSPGRSAGRCARAPRPTCASASAADTGAAWMISGRAPITETAGVAWCSHSITE